MWDIPVFKAEIDAGIADRVRASASIAYCSEVSLTETPQDVIIPDNIKGKRAKAENAGQPDLHYLRSLLVSTGWNKNDDVFDRAEVWTARATPEDKPFNYQHDCTDIIGHITACYPINDAFEKLDPAQALDELPDPYHLGTSSVLYRYWDDEALQARMDEIVPEIAKGAWYVSMEALFRNFDYAAITPEGEHKIIARSNDTAFLTKHLRAYGGTGEYENYRIGRLMRNITFSGKGLVKKPANPASVIFSIANEGVSKRFSPTLGYVLKEAASVTQEISMANENDTLVTQMKAERDEARALIKDLQKQIKELDGKHVEATITTLKEQINAQAAEIKSYREMKAELEASKSDLQKKFDELTAKLQVTEKQAGEIRKQFEETKASLDEVTALQRKADRLSKVSAYLQKDVEDKEVAALVTKLDNLSDEQFDAVLAAMPQIPHGVKNGKKAPIKTIQIGKAKPAGGRVVPAAVADLDEEEDEDEPALVTAGASDEENYDEQVKAVANQLRRKLGRKTVEEN